MEDLVDIPFEVLPPEHGMRADVFLSRKIKRMSRSTAAELIRQGMVRRPDGAPLDKPAARVYAGEQVLLKRRKLEESPIDDILLPILYEDESILAVNKPGDLIVHPTASTYNRTLIRVLRIRRRGEFFSLAHRIDKETSGLVLVTKSPEVDARLKDQFANRTVKKSYLAIVVGVPSQKEFLIDLPMRLKPDSETGVLMEIGGEGAMSSQTEVKVLAVGEKASLVEARPHTGRQHQIRLHLAHLGHPIIGDKLYLGGEDTFVRSLNEDLPDEVVTGMVGHCRHALHAYKATFEHPRTRETTTLTAPLLADMIELLKRHKIPISP